MRPQFGRHHVGQRDLAAVECAGQVDVDDPCPRLGGDLGERRKVEQPRAGHQDADRAQLAADLGERLLHARPVGDIGRNAQRRHTLGPQFLGDALRGFAR